MVQKKKQHHPVVDAVEEEEEVVGAPEADAEPEAAAQEPEAAKKPSRKTGRKEELALKVKRTKAFISTIQQKRHAASKIPRNGENPEWEDERVAIKAVGYPVLMRDAEQDMFYDVHNMRNRTRLTGAKIVLRTNKKGATTEACVLPRAQDAATELILNIAITKVSGFLRATQEYVAMSRRKNIAPRDVSMALRRYGSGFIISRPDKLSAE